MLFTAPPLGETPLWLTSPWLRPALLVAAILASLVLLHGRLGELLLAGLEEVITRCRRLREAGLRLGQSEEAQPVSVGPEGGGVASTADATKATTATLPGSRLGASESIVLVVLARLAYGVLAAECLLGLFLLDTNRTGPVLQLGDSGLRLPFSTGAVLGLLTFALSACWGAFLLDAFGLTPKTVHILPTLGPGGRRFFRIVAAVGNALLLLYVGLLNLVGQLIIQRMQWPLAQLVLATLLGVLLHGAGVFSLWLLVVSLAAVFALLCAVIGLVFSVLRLLLLAIVRHRGAQERPGTAVAAHGVGSEGLMGKTILPSPTVVVGVGEMAQGFLPLVMNSFTRLEGRSTVLATGSCPITNLTDSPVLSPSSGALGPVNLSITRAKAQESLKITGDPIRAAQLLTQYLVQEVIRVVHEKGVQARGQLVWFQDLRSLSVSVGAINAFKAQLPGWPVVVVSEVRARDAHNKQLRAGAKHAVNLWQAETITTTMLLTDDSPLARSVGEEQQYRLAAMYVAAQALAPQHERHSLSLAESATHVGEQSPFSALALWTDPVTSERSVHGWGVLRMVLRKAPVRGIAGPMSLRQQMMATSRRVLEDANTRTVATTSASSLADAPGFQGVTYLIPARLGSENFHKVTEEMRPWLRENAPKAEGSFASGNGVADNKQLASSYYEQVGVLYALGRDDLPPALADALSAQDTPSARDGDWLGSSGMDTSRQVRRVAPSPRAQPQRRKRLRPAAHHATGEN
jgi:hypothetical protein